MASSIALSEASKRLTWRIPAPLETAISVSGTRSSDEPYFGRTLSGGRWHTVSEESVSFNPQPSIAVSISPLDSWATQWEEYHEHAEDGDEGCEFAPDDDDGPGELLKCCGEERPQAPSPITVLATTKEFVTVHDFVSAVHPWLMEHMDIISAAVNVWNGGEAPQGQKLFVDLADPANVDICDEQSWNRRLVYRARPNIVPAVGQHGDGVSRVGQSRPLSALTVRHLNAELRAQGKEFRYPEP